MSSRRGRSRHGAAAMTDTPANPPAAAGGNLAAAADSSEHPDSPPTSPGRAVGAPLTKQITDDIIHLADEFSPWSFTEHEANT